MISGACGLTRDDLEAEEERRKAEASPNHPDRTREVRASAEAVRDVLGEHDAPGNGTSLTG